MGGPRIKNLNAVPLNQNKQHHKAHEHFHFRTTGIKIIGKEDDVQECKECHRILPSTAFTTHTPRMDGAYHLQKICRECHTVVGKEQRDVMKKAPPKPDNCDNCHREKILQIDHIHGTTIFRGWLCRNCNTGIGALGDTLEGILEAAIYLEPDVKIVTETFRKVFDEMFARTNEKK